MHKKHLQNLSATTLILQTVVSILLVLGMNGAAIAQEGQFDAPGSEPIPPPPAPAALTPYDPMDPNSNASLTGAGPTTSAAPSGSASSPPSSTPSNSTPPTPGAATKFNVTKFLKAGGEDQQSYLNSGNPIASFIVKIVNFLVLTIGSVCFVALVIGGFVLLTSHGNENALTKGKDIIKNALIGLIVVLCSYFITAFVQSLFYEQITK